MVNGMEKITPSYEPDKGIVQEKTFETDPEKLKIRIKEILNLSEDLENISDQNGLQYIYDHCIEYIDWWTETKEGSLIEGLIEALQSILIDLEENFDTSTVRVNAEILISELKETTK